MTRDEIANFDINSELTVNQKIKLTFKDGKLLYGFFKLPSESESFETLKQKNKWDFILIPQDSIPPKVTTIEGDEILHLEITDATAISN